jgi:hypothetical protein
VPFWPAPRPHRHSTATRGTPPAHRVRARARSRTTSKCVSCISAVGKSGVIKIVALQPGETDPDQWRVAARPSRYCLLEVLFCVFVYAAVLATIHSLQASENRRGIGFSDCISITNEPARRLLRGRTTCPRGKSSHAQKKVLE